MEKQISLQTLQRMPVYLNFLKTHNKFNYSHVSAKAIADALGLGEIQVRKDLASISNKGKPKLGYVTTELIADIEAALGYSDIKNAVLVGAGKLGKALLSYKGFNDYGLNIVAAFDCNESEIGIDDSLKPIYPIEFLPEFCEKEKISIGIITVPEEFAQNICDSLVCVGITAIWNFAPTHLNAPEHVLIKNENMAASLALLSKHIT